MFEGQWAPSRRAICVEPARRFDGVEPARRIDGDEPARRFDGDEPARRIDGDELVFDLLKSGFDAACFDGQNVFDTDHPLEDANGDTVTVSNMQAGADPGWYLWGVSRGVRPIIWPEREGYEFTSVNRHDDAHVFTHDAYMYGVRDAG